MSSAFSVQDKTVAREAEVAERDKLRAEANGASMRFNISTMNAIERAQKMLKCAQSKEDKQRSRMFIEGLMEKISSGDR